MALYLGNQKVAPIKKIVVSEGGITDVKVDGTSVVTNHVANIDLSRKQEVLTAGSNITIARDPETEELVISATGGSSDCLWEEGTGTGSLVTKSSVPQGGQATGDYALAEGYGSDAKGNYSHAEGQLTTTNGACAHAEGQGTTAQGNCSHTEGIDTIAQNQSEHAEGQYNKSHKANNTFGNAGNTIHSVGIGTGAGSLEEQDRRNAIEVMQNGDIYINGIGGYDGADYSTADTLQDVIDSKADSYTPGAGIDITNNEISIDEEVVATQADLIEKQNQLVIGTPDDLEIIPKGAIKHYFDSVKAVYGSIYRAPLKVNEDGVGSLDLITVTAYGRTQDYLAGGAFYDRIPNKVVMKFKYYDVSRQYMSGGLFADTTGGDIPNTGCTLRWNTVGTTLTMRCFNSSNVATTYTIETSANTDYYLVFEKTAEKTYNAYLTTDLDNLGTAYSFYLDVDDYTNLKPQYVDQSMEYPDGTRDNEVFNGLGAYAGNDLDKDHFEIDLAESYYENGNEKVYFWIAGAESDTLNFIGDYMSATEVMDYAQPKLTAGTNISIEKVGNNTVISATGGGTEYTEGRGIDINSSNEISVLTGDGLTFDSDDNLTIDYDEVQKVLTPGTGIDITDDTITVTGVKETHNNSLLKFYKCTQAEYDAIVSKDSSTMYVIIG